MGQKSLVSSLVALPLETATRICVDFVEHLIPKDPALRHRLQCILNPPRSSLLPEIDSIWDEEAIKRQTQDEDLLPELITTARGINISNSLRRLKPYGELNDEIINEYLGLLRKEAPENVFIADSYLCRRPSFDDRISTIILPLHHPKSDHWTLVVLKKEHGTSRFRPVLYDSFCSKAPKVPEHLRAWLADMDLCEESTGTPNPQQNCFSTDCGLFLLLGARLIASGKHMPSQAEARQLMSSFRRRVLVEILAGKLNPNSSDYEEFRKAEEERQTAARDLVEPLPNPGWIILNHGQMVVDLVSPTTSISSGDLTIATAGLNSNNFTRREPPSTIDPSIISYQPAPHTPTEIMSSLEISQNVEGTKGALKLIAIDSENTLESPQMDSMFVSSPETDKGCESPEEIFIRTMPSLPTPASSRSTSPVSFGSSPITIRTSPGPSRPHSAASLQTSSCSSSFRSSQVSVSSSVSSDGNTTISAESLAKLAIPDKTYRKSPLVIITSDCSTVDTSGAATKLPQAISSLSSSQGRSKMLLNNSRRRMTPIALKDLKNLPSVLEAAKSESGLGAFTISLQDATSHPQLDIDISHSTMVQSIIPQEDIITLQHEKMEKKIAVTLPAPGPRVELDQAGLEQIVLSFEDHMHKGGVAKVDYAVDILVTSPERRKQLRLPSSRIANPAGNALLHTSSKFDGIHTPMAHLSGEYGTCFSAHIENYGLHSMNYLWYGAPKVWIIISPHQKQKFETLVRDLTKTRKKCSQFVRHEGVFLTLGVIKRACIEYQIIIQRPGEMVFTFADTYHQGFNLGPNLAEAINYATDLRNIESYLACTSFCPGGEQIPRSGLLPSKDRIFKRRLSGSSLEPNAVAKKQRESVNVLASFANPSFMAHMLQHAIAAKRRSVQEAHTRRDLFGLWRIVNTNNSLQTLESRYFREMFAREWKKQWENQPKRSAGQFMREELGFQNCFESAHKAARRAKLWVELCDIFNDDLGNNCIVAICAVAEITSTTEQLGRYETMNFLRGVADQKRRVLPLLKAVIPAFQFVLGLQPTLPTLPIEELNMSGDVISKEFSELSITRFEEYFKVQP